MVIINQVEKSTRQIPLTWQHYRRVFWALESGDGAGDLGALETEAYQTLVYWPGDTFGEFYERNRARVQVQENREETA